MPGLCTISDIMDYIIVRFAKKQDSWLISERDFDINPRVLANEKPVRFGRSRLQRHIGYETMRPLETTTRTKGSFNEPREVNSLNVMLLHCQAIGKALTPSERRTLWKK